jgi:ABC-type dipeptide/oligopeptide/nickel transport system permease subunit
MAGALGGATMAVATGYILESTGQNYMLIFLIAGFAYLAALGVIHLLSPKLQPLDQIDSASINPVSIGSIVGFGFIGLMFGTFGGWVFGLVTRAAGKDLFLDMISGAGIGAIIGIVVGFIICSRLAKKAAP